MKFAAIIVVGTLELFHGHLFQSRQVHVMSSPICVEGSETTDTCFVQWAQPENALGRKHLSYVFDLEY